jgi:hypothetical protein
MLIDELVAYCDSRYRRTDRCPGCPNDCKGGCEACLDAIHFGRIIRPYNCENISNFYVCKYIYKYASEIDHLITRFEPLKRLDAYHILSVGCGPCTELAGVLSFLSRNHLQRPVSFLGIDSNTIWRPIHDRLQSIASGGKHNMTVGFEYGDALEIVPRLCRQGRLGHPNILTLQYLISNLVVSCANVQAFVAGLSNSIVTLMPADSFIVLNDINHFLARDHFDSIERSVTKSHATTVYKAHFRNKNRIAYEYGEQHPANQLTGAIPAKIRTPYNPWDFCSSAQMVIEKRS